MKKITKSLMVLIALSTSIYDASAQNTNLGTSAGNAGTYNTSIGAFANEYITGTQNTSVGNNTGKSTTSGSYNTFMGVNCGYYNITGSHNSFFGRYSGFKNTSGVRNTFVGNSAGQNNVTGHDNCYVGIGAGALGTDDGNTCVGAYSGYSTPGAGNTFLGYTAGYYNTGSYNVFIGYQAGRSNVTGSNMLIIDNSDRPSDPLIIGDFEGQWVRINNTLYVDGSIKCESVEVKNIAADYVFEEGYNLRSLKEVEAFITNNGHLPDIAPASETSQGVELAKFNTLLLQKIEELTLYMIELKKENEAIKNDLKSINDQYKFEN